MSACADGGPGPESGESLTESTVTRQRPRAAAARRRAAARGPGPGPPASISGK